MLPINQMKLANRLGNSLIGKMVKLILQFIQEGHSKSSARLIQTHDADYCATILKEVQATRLVLDQQKEIN